MNVADIALILLGLLLLFGVGFLVFSPQFGGRSEADSLARIQKSPHFRHRRFHNLEKLRRIKRFRIKLFMQLLKRVRVNPDGLLPIVKLSKGYFDGPLRRGLRATWFGHSAMLVEMDGKKIFCDPMLGKISAPLPINGLRRFGELPMPVESLPKLDVVLISHDHYDHLDYWSVMRLKGKVKKFFVPLGIGGHLRRWGVDREKIEELDWWDEVSFGNLIFELVPSRHFSGRTPFDRNKTLWGSWVIRGKTANIFFGGDSGYHRVYKEIGEKYGPFDLTMLDCGQYNELWADMHMTPEETIRAHLDLKGKLLLPIHWGAFILSPHPWNEPIERVLKQAAKMKVRVTTPKIGESVVPGVEEPRGVWWKKLRSV